MSSVMFKIVEVTGFSIINGLNFKFTQPVEKHPKDKEILKELLTIQPNGSSSF